MREAVAEGEMIFRCSQIVTVSSKEPAGTKSIMYRIVRSLLSMRLEICQRGICFWVWPGSLPYGNRDQNN